MANEKFLDSTGLSRFWSNIKTYVGNNSSIVRTTQSIGSLSATVLNGLKAGDVVVSDNAMGKETYIVLEDTTSKNVSTKGLYLINITIFGIKYYIYVKDTTNNTWSTTGLKSRGFGVEEETTYEDVLTGESKTGEVQNTDGVVTISGQQEVYNEGDGNTAGFYETSTCSIEVNGDTITITASDDSAVNTKTLVVTPTSITISDGTDTINLFTDFIGVDDLTNYYLKSETYTKTEVNNLIAAIPSITYTTVSSLPTAGATYEFNTTKTIYMVAQQSGTNTDYYDEYICVQRSSSYYWEKIGNTQVDLSNYYTKSQTDTLLNGKQDAMSALTNNEIDAICV